MSSKPYVVAIAGGTCSGKSTLCDKLAEQFATRRTVVFHMDHYYKKNPPTTVAPITGITYVEHNHPDALELDRLYADFTAALQSDAELILIEGLFALHLAEIREVADCKVFVDLASDARVVRRIKKHMAWGQTYEQVTDRFIDTVRFRHNELVEPTRWHADMVINGTPNQGADILRTFLASKLSR